MNWNDYRDADGNIELFRVFQSVYPPSSYSDIDYDRVGWYLSMVETLMPIRSRQAAAIAIATAAELFVFRG